MKSFKFTISDPAGMHARPAGMLVKKAAAYASDINIVKDGKKVSAKGILGIMGLAAKKGDEITVEISGADEDNAAKEFEAFLKENL